MRRALAIDEESLGPAHPASPSTSTIWRSSCKATNRLAEAEPLMRRALDIFTASLGPDHPNTKIVAANYSLLLEIEQRKRSELSSRKRRRRYPGSSQIEAPAFLRSRLALRFAGMTNGGRLA